MTTEQLPHPPLASPEEWRAERLKLLAEEKAHTKQYDRINAQRRRLPMIKLEKTYTFEGPEGPRTLLDLFDGRRQLIVYHFMFDPSWNEGCSGCTGYVDALGDLSMLADKSVRFVLISRAPLEKLGMFKQQKGWLWPWYSSLGSDFNYDFHATLDESKAPIEYNYEDKAALEERRGKGHVEGEDHGLSVFFRVGDEVHHTYSVFARGVENLTNSVALLDVTPYGRQEDFEDSPKGWPQKPTYG